MPRTALAIVMAMLTPAQKHDPEIVIAMFLQAAP
jgi:hypothetical protein